MKAKAIIVMFVVAIFLAGLGNVLNESVIDVKAGGTLGGGGNILYVGGNGPNNYTKIQDAINDATNGDTIFVFNGTYYEHITINKTINLIGENKHNTIIDGSGSGDVVYISADTVNLSRFTIRKSGGSNTEYVGGIHIVSNSNVLSNNIITDCWRAMYLKASSDNTIFNNYITYHAPEIRIRFESDCDNNIFNNNTIINCSLRMLYQCNYNIIEYNTFDKCGVLPSPFSDNNIIQVQ